MHTGRILPAAGREPAVAAVLVAGRSGRAADAAGRGRAAERQRREEEEKEEEGSGGSAAGERLALCSGRAADRGCSLLPVWRCAASSRAQHAVPSLPVDNRIGRFYRSARLLQRPPIPQRWAAVLPGGGRAARRGAARSSTAEPRAARSAFRAPSFFFYFFPPLIFTFLEVIVLRRRRAEVVFARLSPCLGVPVRWERGSRFSVAEQRSRSSVRVLLPSAGRGKWRR